MHVATDISKYTYFSGLALLILLGCSQTCSISNEEVWRPQNADELREQTQGHSGRSEGGRWGAGSAGRDGANRHDEFVSKQLTLKLFLLIY